MSTRPLAASCATAGDQSVAVPGHFVEPAHSAAPRCRAPHVLFASPHGESRRSGRCSPRAPRRRCPRATPCARCSRLPDAAGGDHRHADRVGHRARQLEVEAVARAVAVHAGEQDLARARAAIRCAHCDGVEPGRAAAAVRVDLPAVAACAWRRSPPRCTARRRCSTPRRPAPGRCTAAVLMRDLVGAGVEQARARPRPCARRRRR